MSHILNPSLLQDELFTGNCFELQDYYIWGHIVLHQPRHKCRLISKLPVAGLYLCTVQE